MIATLSFFIENISNRYIVLLAQRYTSLCHLTGFVQKIISLYQLFRYFIISMWPVQLLMVSLSFLLVLLTIFFPFGINFVETMLCGQIRMNPATDNDCDQCIDQIWPSGEIEQRLYLRLPPNTITCLSIVSSSTDRRPKGILS